VSWSGDFGLGRLLESLTRRGVGVTLGKEAAKALHEQVKGLARNALSSYGDSSRRAVLNALDPSLRVEVLKAVGDLLPVDGAGAGRLLSLFEPSSVFQVPWLAEKPEAFAVLAIHVLEHLNEEWVTAFARAVGDNERLLSQLDAPGRATLTEAVVRRQTPPPTERMMGSLQDLTRALKALGSSDDVVPA
jgi:hypothetical protein